MTKTIFSFNSKTLSRQHGTKFFIALCVLLFSSCKKESELGIDIQPEEDLIGCYTTDTTTLNTWTVIEDSLRTDETPTIVLGTCVDADFGTTTAGVYSQFSIPNNLNDINFGAVCPFGQTILDSAVLMISYKYDFYGDTLFPQTLSVYQMTDMIYKDSVYYSNQTKNFNPAAIGSLSFYPTPRKSKIVGTDTLPAHLRIPIDLNWANLVFAQSGGTNLASNSNWLEFMNGLYIASTGTAGKSLLYFNLLDSLTGLRFYYHNTCGDTTDFTFVVNSSAAYFSHYDHDYSGANVNFELGDQLSTPGGQNAITFVQSNAGLKTKIEFPFLKNWYDNLGYPVAINKAELVIFGDETFASDNFPLNTRLFLTSIDSFNKEHLLIDMFESSSYYGGPLNTTTNCYKINIARYIQGVLSGEEENNGIYLKEIFGTENGRRSVLGGTSSTGDPAKKMYLRLVYTRIN